MMRAAEQVRGPLRIEADPFAPGGADPHLGQQLQLAFREIARQILLQTPIVLVTGDSSTGKTLLTDMTARVCADMGLSVQRVDRGDLLHVTLGQDSDVLLVDEATSVADSILEALSIEGENSAATTAVFLGLPSCAARFMSKVHPVVIPLTPLSLSDARDYLWKRATDAGMPDLFTDEALELILEESRGSPRLLRSIASTAFFNAASDNTFHISHEHVASALATQLPFSAQAVDERTLQRPSADETFDKRKRPTEISSGPTRTAPNVDSTPRIEEWSNKNQGAARPSSVQKPSEAIWARSKPIPAKNDRAFQIASGGYRLPESFWQRRADDTPVEQPVSVRGRSKVGRRTIIVGIAIAIAAAAIVATVMPSMLASAGFYAAAGLNNQPAPAQASQFVESTPALPKPANDAEKIPKAASAQSRADNISSPVGESTNAGADRTSPRKAAEERTAARRPLSAEEEAAVARGIQEMEKERLQSSQFSPR